MKFRNILLFITILLVGINQWGADKINVVTTYRYIADITQRIGGDRLSVTSLAPGNLDPHFITPKPSFIARLRKADLLIINGGQLEIGWIPPVLQQANNPGIMPGSKGFLSLMEFIEPLDVNLNASRAQGDVHPEGNPHIQMDPYNIPLFAAAIKDELCRLDEDHCTDYQKNCDSFIRQWAEKTAEWDSSLARLNGVKVVEYHKLYEYLVHRYHIEVINTIEPLPGIPPSSRHIAEIIESIEKQNARLILQDVYHGSQVAKYISGKTGAKVVIIPHDVGAVKEVTDIFSLFDEITRRLTGS
ncbi:MAG: Zinc transporter solute-binding protein [Acidobacteriota bacterium]|nr:Zinc transporter solute-binding protein [Acidobacteriota bacterium]